MTYFDSIPTTLRQTFSRIRRSSGGSADSYGDATFTEQTTTGFKGFFQFGAKKGESIILAGKEISYDATVYTSGTMLVGEDDILVFGSSTSTSIGTRYHVGGVNPVYEKGVVDHKQLYVKQEVV